MTPELRADIDTMQRGVARLMVRRHLAMFMDEETFAKAGAKPFTEEELVRRYLVHTRRHGSLTHREIAREVQQECLHDLAARWRDEIERRNTLVSVIEISPS